MWIYVQSIDCLWVIEICDDAYMTKKSPANLRAVDLFCGCGGLSQGFQNAGFDILASFDCWKPAVEVYKANFKHPVYDLDLSGQEAQKLIKGLKADIIVGGPPCQDFSSAGHRDERLGRADLTHTFCDIVVECKPRYFLMENVPRIQKSGILDQVKRRFKKAGYGLTGVTLDASRCGVPQQRLRFFLLGCIGADDNFLESSLLNGQADTKMTVHDYLGDSLGFEYYFRVPRSYQRRGVFSIHEPAMTVRGVDRPVPSGYKGHPADPVSLNKNIRTLTFKERSLIQTFPPKFKFEGTKTNLNQMIGNAVPVKLAEYVAHAIAQHSHGKKQKN